MLDKIKTLTKNLSKEALTLAKGAKSANRRTASTMVALDIGTEFVKALVARIKGDNLEIIGVGRAHQELADMQAGAIADIGAVVRNCDAALNDAETQAGVSARSAIIGIAGELVKGTTTTVKCTRKNSDKPMDENEVERIIELVQDRAQKRARQALAWELGGQEVDVRLVNSALEGIEIDGYKVTNPVGFQGKDVVVQLYTAFAPMIHIGALERTAQELDLDLLAVAAEPFAVARSVIGDDPNASMSAVLMDVGGGTTDIAVLSDGGVQGTKMFGIGGRAFTKSIERELNLDFVRAEALKLGLSTNKTPRTIIANVESALDKTLKVWVSGVELALSEFSRLDHLPNRLLLCGGGASLDLLMDNLRDGEWYRQLPFTKRPTVEHIKPNQVVGIVDKTGAVNDHTYITAMGLLRVGMDTNYQASGKPDSLLKERINRLLST